MPAAVIALWLLWGLICGRKIGGMTGDTFGAGIEIGETAGFLLLYILTLQGLSWSIL
jgi:cobalamin synthase